MKRNRTWLAIFMTLALFLSACAGTPAPSTPAPATPAPAPSTPAPSSPAAETPTTDGILIHSDRSDPATLDPAMAAGTSTYMQGLLLFDTLLAQDNQGNIQPLLATSWTTSPDGKVYTFKLRTDVEFHSGKKMTSADVKYSLERVADRSTGSAWVSLVSQIASIDTPDPATVVITMKAPDRLILQNLSHSGTVIQNKDAIEKAGPDYGKTVVDGTGPFVLKSRVINESITYERFDKYKWGPSFYKNPGPAHIKTIQWRNVSELTTRQLMVEKGEIDTIMHNSPPAVFRTAADLKGKGVDVLRRPVVETRALILNSAYPAFSDLAVRQAIAMAVDAKSIAEALYAPLGQQAFNLMHFSTYGYWKGSETQAYKFDLAKAAQTLEDAGWKRGADGVRAKDGIVLKDLPMMGLPQYAVTAAPIQEALASIGIQVKIDMQERGVLYPKRSTGDVPMEISNFIGTADQLSGLFHSSRYPGSNRVGLKDSKLDNALLTFQTSPDETAALAAINEVQKIFLIDEAVFIPIYWTSELSIINTRNIKGFESSTWMNSGLGKLLDAWSLRK